MLNRSLWSLGLALTIIMGGGALIRLARGEEVYIEQWMGAAAGITVLILKSMRLTRSTHKRDNKDN